MSPDVPFTNPTKGRGATATFKVAVRKLIFFPPRSLPETLLMRVEED